jgi:hypothetical protein
MAAARPRRGLAGVALDGAVGVGVRTAWYASTGFPFATAPGSPWRLNRPPEEPAQQQPAVGVAALRRGPFTASEEVSARTRRRA